MGFGHRGAAWLGYSAMGACAVAALLGRDQPPVLQLTVSTADRLIQDRQVKDYMINIMREVLAIGRAVGVDADIDPEARIDMARALGKFKTSMLQDLEAGKPLEIDGLLAGTLEIARKAGVPAPYTEMLYGLIKARAQATGDTISSAQITLLPSMDLRYLAGKIEYRGKTLDIVALQAWFSQFPEGLRPVAWTLIRHISISQTARTKWCLEFRMG